MLDVRNYQAISARAPEDDRLIEGMYKWKKLKKLSHDRLSELVMAGGTGWADLLQGHLKMLRILLSGY